MAIILLCEECESTMTIHAIDPTKKIVTLARRCGWTRTAQGWICPQHNQNIEDNYQTAAGSTLQSSEADETPSG